MYIHPKLYPPKYEQSNVEYAESEQPS